MNATPPAPRMGFVIQLQTHRTAAADVARIEHVVHLFRGHRLPCTWSIAGCCSLELMRHQGLLGRGDELALQIGTEGTTADGFRGQLRQRLAAMHACSGEHLQLVAGDPAILRPHAAILAEQGIRAVLSTSGQRPAASQTPLPCGLWQMNFGAAIPRQSRLFGWGAGNQGVLRKVARLTAADKPLLVSVDATLVAHANARSLQQLEKLVQAVSQAASRREVRVVTIREILADLAAERVSRPQQSILRAA